MSIHKLISDIQDKLKAPKGQFNSFGKYKYRSCEDIVEAVKPLLGEGFLNISDEVVLVGDRYYIKSTAKIYFENDTIEAVAFAREALTKKGMDDSQVTGAASSYARKFALNGLLAIDDTKDADSDAPAAPPTNPELTPESKQWGNAVAAYKRDGNLDKITARVTISDANKQLIKDQADVD